MVTMEELGCVHRDRRYITFLGEGSGHRLTGELAKLKLKGMPTQ
jgi:hypothetical protein